MADAETIRNFMWGYQRHFRITMTLSAEALFSLIDPAFAPGVFLVGVRAEDAEGPAVCVEPEADFWLTADRFTAAWPKKFAGPMAPSAAAMADGTFSRQWRRNMHEAVESLLSGLPERPQNRRYFVTMPVDVGHYWVVGVMELESSALAAYQFPAANLSVDPNRLPESLLEVVIEVFLSRMEAELGIVDPFGNILPGRELLRTSASLLTDALVFGATGQYDSSGFYDKCMKISSTFYEGLVAAGGMVVAPRDDEQLDYEIRFSMPPELSDIRQARKLLQTASDYDLATDGSRLYGLVKRRRAKAKLKVRFTGHRQWQLIKGSKVLLEIKYDEPGLPKPANNTDHLSQALHHLFPKLTGPQTANLLKLIDSVSRARHGALLVITELAAREAKRLRSQAMPIERKKLTPQLLESMSNIDGAVMVNPRGIAFAMGVILDGPATANGNTARGARYNSAIRYCEYLRDRFNASCFIVVVSDDGDTSFVPGFNHYDHPRAPLPAKDPLYDEIADITHYGRSLFIRHDNDMIKMLFEPLEKTPEAAPKPAEK